MIYTDKTKLAMQIAFEAHIEQVDKSGIPYIYHPIHLAEQMLDEDTCIVALLHDVIEDTDITIDDLKKYGFTDKQLNALLLLTHEQFVPYMEYIEKISTDKIATTVKIADLKHNSDISRIDRELTEKDFKRLDKYKKTLDFLENKRRED